MDTSIPTGLGSDEARALRAEHGPNRLRQVKRRPAWRALLAQFAGPLTALLLVACAVAAVVGERTDAVAIGAILLVNAGVGFLQERRAERAVAALRDLTAPHARVLRDGRSRMVSAEEVVPGDVLLLEAGDRVPADAALLEANALSAQEAALTGESVPVRKAVGAPSPGDAPLAERGGQVFAGTTLATGSGTARVTATGMKTELGKVAKLLEEARPEETPLQRRLAGVGRQLVLLCLGLVALVALVGVLRGEPAWEIGLSSIALAVAAVPEGLPAIVTIALALGMERMAGKGVVVRRLPAVETLGCATLICTDKTGTLTRGVMEVRELRAPDERALLQAAAACCDAELGAPGEPDSGDPTEVALLRAALEHGITRSGIEAASPRRQVEPFDPLRKWMSVLRADGVRYVKGAPEVLLPLSPAADPERIERDLLALTERGLRVLAIATSAGPAEGPLTLLGLVGIADPPRPEAIAAVAAARAAGVRTVMITGDHPSTARAIAREMGILLPGEDPAERVHARATPEQKLEIVRGWKARGEVVAMTGDGVNDAPALREADIGVAMGEGGTEVAREAAAMVLMRDDFSGVVEAIREGRGIYENIRKTVVYLLVGNAAELMVMLLAEVAGLPLPLLPLQLLWINLFTDSLPALALVTDAPPPDVMDRAPRPPEEPLLGNAQWTRIALTAALDAVVTLGAFLLGLRAGGVELGRDLAFTTLVLAEVLRAFAARDDRRTFWALGPFTNMRLVAVVAATFLLQLGLHAFAPTRALLHLQPLTLGWLAVVVALGLVPVTVLEVFKRVRR